MICKILKPLKALRSLYYFLGCFGSALAAALLDIWRKGEVVRLVDVEVLEEEGGHLLEAEHGRVATDGETEVL